MTKFSAYLTGCSSAPSQIRHPERSAAHIYPITNGLLRGVEGPRRCLLVHALQSFPTTNYEPNKKFRAEPRDLRFSGPLLEMFFSLSAVTLRSPLAEKGAQKLPAFLRQLSALDDSNADDSALYQGTTLVVPQRREKNWALAPAPC